MTIFMIIFTLAAILFSIGTVATYRNGSRDLSFYYGATTCCIIASLLFTGGIICNYVDANKIEEKIQSIQEQATKAIEDGAQDKERAVIRAELFTANNELLQLQRDNDSWIWKLQTPDSVKYIKPARMIAEHGD